MRILLIILFIAAVIAPAITYSQPYISSPNPPGSFTVDQVIGCVPFTVTITAPDCDGTPGCGMLHDINDPASTGKSLLNTDGIPDTLVYSKPGTYTLLVVIGTQEHTIQITARPNPLPIFEAYACSGSRISVRVTTTSYNGGYIVDYPTLTKPLASGVSDVQVLPNGVQNIRVRGIYTGGADNCPSSVQSVDIQPTLAVPAITELTATSLSALDLDFNHRQSVLYRLQIATNSSTLFQNLPNVVNTGTVTINSNVAPDNNYYCFHIAAIDYCSNTVGAFSNTVCSANFDVVATNNQDEASWVTSPTGVLTFDIKRNATPLPSATAMPNTTTSKIDTDIICNTPYTYQLISNYSGAQSISLPKTVTALSTDAPPPIENITAAVRPTGGVELTWPPEALASKYFIYRSSESTAIDTTLTANSIDPNYTTGGDFCYRVRYNNACGIAGVVGIESCPLHLTGQTQKDNVIVLTWPPYTGWQNGVSGYTLEKYSSNGQLLQTFSVIGTETTYTDATLDATNQTYIYIVKADANDSGLGQAISNSLTIIKQPNIFYPTAFSPNSDGVNDKFIVWGQFVSAFEMKIFNRWGELMYTAKSLNDGWDGNYKGIAMPEGTYAFVADLTDFEGRSFKRSGSVVLLRKK